MHYLEKELFESLGENKFLFDFLKDVVFDGIWYWDLEKPENEWLSPKFWTTFDYNPADFDHSPEAWQEIIFKEDFELAKQTITAHLQNPENPFDTTIRYHHKSGETVWIHCRGIAIRNEQGIPIRMFGAHIKASALILHEVPVVGEKSAFELFDEAVIGLNLSLNNDASLESKYPLEMIGFLYKNSQDQTKVASYIEEIEQKAELSQQIKKRDELLGLLTQNASDTFLLFNNKHELVFVTPAFERITGNKITQLPMSGQDVMLLIAEEFRDEIMSKIMTSIENKVESISYAYRTSRVDEEVWLEDVASFVYDENGNYLKSYVVSRNITQRKKLELELKAEIEKRKQITEDLLHIKEKDKEEIYTELHDGVNQLLFAAKLQIENASINESQEIELAKSFLHQAIEEIRRIALESTSQFVTEGCFIGGLSDYLRKLNQNSKIQFSVDNQVIDFFEITDLQKKHLFRICQELTQNAIKHSNGNRMCFRLKYEDSEFKIICRDNGNVQKSLNQNGVGLKSIHDRVYLLNGKVRMLNFKNSGLITYLAVPLPKMDDEKVKLILSDKSDDFMFD